MPACRAVALDAPSPATCVSHAVEVESLSGSMTIGLVWLPDANNRNPLVDDEDSIMVPLPSEPTLYE